MMIRINLLPVRAAAKRESGRQFVVGGLLLLGMTVGANYFWYSNRNDERTRKEDEVAATKAKIAQLEKTIGEVNNINKRKKEVGEKLESLNKLRQQRGGPVRMLDALSSCTPKKVWIEEFGESNLAVRISGRGESLEDVSEFMKGLTNIVWTPKGMGRIVEKKRDASTIRVELLTGDGAMEDFTVDKVVNFFTNVELKNTEISGAFGPVAKTVKFEITLAARYAI